MEPFNYDISDYVRAHPNPPPVKVIEPEPDTASMLAAWVSSWRFALWIGMVWLFSPRKGRKLLDDAMILQTSLAFKNIFFPKPLQNRIGKILHHKIP